MKIICIGRNYSDHAKELNNKVPEQPVFFMKPDTAIVKNNKPFFLPDFSENVHYELELVYKICKVGKNIAKKFAHRYYNEIALGIDFTARDLQEKCKEKGLPWEIAKSFDNSAPISDFVAKEELNNIHEIPFSLMKNEELVQDGRSSDMIFHIDSIIEYVSQFLTLKTGDLIFSGTPAGVGPVKIGDHLQAYLEDKLMMDFYIK